MFKSWFFFQVGWQVIQVALRLPSLLFLHIVNLPDAYNDCCGFPATLLPVKNVLVHHARTHTSTETQSRSFLCVASNATGRYMGRHRLSPPVEDTGKAPLPPIWLWCLLSDAIIWFSVLVVPENSIRNSGVSLSSIETCTKFWFTASKHKLQAWHVQVQYLKYIKNLIDVVVLAVILLGLWLSCFWPFFSVSSFKFWHPLPFLKQRGKLSFTRIYY